MRPAHGRLQVRPQSKWSTTWHELLRLHSYVVAVVERETLLLPLRTGGAPRESSDGCTGGTGSPDLHTTAIAKMEPLRTRKLPSTFGSRHLYSYRTIRDAFQSPCMHISKCDDGTRATFSWLKGNARENKPRQSQQVDTSQHIDVARPCTLPNRQQDELTSLCTTM
jgi:hypothetical protein